MSAIPRQEDVLFGKGSAINQHPGNKNFRSIVDKQKATFAVVDRKTKRRIATKIINDIHHAGGRFLGEDISKNAGTASGTANKSRGSDKNGGDNEGIHHKVLAKTWMVVQLDKVMVKVMHRLREKEVTRGDQQQKPQEANPEVQQPSFTNGGPKSPGRKIILSSNEDSILSEQLDLDDLEGLPTSTGSPEEFAQNENTHSPDSITQVYENIIDAVEPIALSSGNPQQTKLDEEMTSFLHRFGEEEEGEYLDTFQEETLRDWMQRSRCKYTTQLDYIKAGLPIAIKLTECLIEAEKDEVLGEPNPIPLASIMAANVLVRSDVNRTMGTEVIDLVSIMSHLGDTPDTGVKNSRLVSLGFLLHELFSGEEPTYEDTRISEPEFSLISISLNNEDKSNHRPRKKSQRSQDEYASSHCIQRLKYLGAPNSISSLVGNLIDLTQGEACTDEAYSSFSDLLSDLQLLRDDPYRFLDDIIVNPLPSLLIPEKLYGREKEVQHLEELYQRSLCGTCTGVIIKGTAGVGKTTLAMHLQKLASNSNSYFLWAKFDENQNAPLATVGSLFDDLCNMFVRDSTDNQRKIVGESLQRSLGIQASLLIGILPSLSKLLPSCVKIEHSFCFDVSMSVSFLFGELLREISSHSKKMAFFLDDIHLADPISLLLVGSLIQANIESVFFTCTYRDEVDTTEAFNQWLRSNSELETIKLGNITEEGVNQLISDSLHLSPRITRPLSHVVYRKAGAGNSLFLRQLLESLKEKGYIYVDLRHPKWAWDLEKILELEISEDVVSLLIDEMQKLDADLQQGLKIAACIGFSVRCSVLDILSEDMGTDLSGLLKRVSKKGLMEIVGDTNGFCFCHGKIQQAAYELLSDQEKHDNHMRLGLAICSSTLNSGNNNDDLFFTSVHQINLAGPSASLSHHQRVMLASLNLKAGNRSIELSDFFTAFKFFKFGVLFLGDSDDHWTTDYSLSIELYDAASTMACLTNDMEAVTRYTQQVFAYARCPNDKISCGFSNLICLL